MLTEIAEVVAVKPGHAVLAIERKSSCHSCDKSDNCGTSAVSNAFSKERYQFELPTNLALKVGQKVEVATPEKPFVLSVAIVYLTPLWAMFLFAVLGYYLDPLSSQDASSALFGGLGILVSGVALKRFNQHITPKTVIIKAYQEHEYPINL